VGLLFPVRWQSTVTTDDYHEFLRERHTDFLAVVCGVCPGDDEPDRLDGGDGNTHDGTSAFLLFYVLPMSVIISDGG